MKVQCSRCSQEHDLEHMDPSFALPDVVFALSPAERKKSARIRKDMCALPDKDLYFMRVLLRFHVANRLRPCNWGVWVQVEYKVIQQMVELWDDDARLDMLPATGALANELTGYPGSLGLQGELRFANLTDIPYFTLGLDSDHPLAQDQRTGVSAERAVDWLVSIAHG